MRLPYFAFYPADWMMGSKVRRLSFEERGVFVELLCYAWLQDGLPNNPWEVARMLNLDPADEAVASRVARVLAVGFHPDADDMHILRNERQELERVVAEEKYLARKRQTAAARKAMLERKRGYAKGRGKTTSPVTSPVTVAVTGERVKSSLYNREGAAQSSEPELQPLPGNGSPPAVWQEMKSKIQPSNHLEQP
jgi:uncharacterized protein YdaU (DUF1376 family)